MHSRLSDRAPRRRRLISLTPLIDVVFILLIFLMLVSNFVDYRTMSLSLTAGASGGAGTSSPIRIRLLQGGGLTVDGNPATLHGLATILENRSGTARGQKILIYPDTGVPVQRVVHVLDKLIEQDIHGAVLANDRRAAQ